MLEMWDKKISKCLSQIMLCQWSKTTDWQGMGERGKKMKWNLQNKTDQIMSAVDQIIHHPSSLEDSSVSSSRNMKQGRSRVQWRRLSSRCVFMSPSLAWRIPWTEKPGRLQSMGSQRVGHDWAASLSLSLCFPRMWSKQSLVRRGIKFSQRKA